MKTIIVKDIKDVRKDVFAVIYRIVGERFDRRLEVSRAQLAEIKKQAPPPPGGK